MAAKKTRNSRSVGNKKRMTEINSEYIHSFFKELAEKNNTTQSAMSEECGWSSSYINQIKRLKAIPENNLQLLCIKYGLDYKKATDIEPKLQPKCEYCLTEEENPPKIFGVRDACGFNFESWIDCGNELVTTLWINDRSFTIAKEKISFCPFCGRKLERGTISDIKFDISEVFTQR